MIGEALINNPPATNHKELELVITCISLDPLKEMRIDQILDNTLDWSKFMQIANQQGVLPICCQQVINHSDHRIQSDTIDSCNEIIRVNHQKNLRLAWKLVECVNLLADHGIEHVVLKGPIFAVQAYPNLSLRQFSDLDILIHPKDFSKVYDLLEASGYEPKQKLGRKQIKFQVWSDNQYSFYRQGDTFEIHWDVAPRENIDPWLSEQMWKEKCTVQVLDKRIETLSLENTILFICLHGAKHGWKQLKWIVDLAYYYPLIPENAWTALLDYAKRNGLSRQLSLGLLLASDLVGLTIPGNIHDLISSDPHAQELASKVAASLFRGTLQISLMNDYLFYGSTRERWKDRFCYFIELIFVPKNPDWNTLLLPEWLYFMYYLTRPIRLLYLASKSLLTNSA